MSPEELHKPGNLPASDNIKFPSDHRLFESPIDISGPAKNCVEVRVYDNDGPEGYYKRARFERSWQAMEFLKFYFTDEDLFDRNLNYEIKNYWKQ